MNRYATLNMTTAMFVQNAAQYIKGRVLDVGCGSQPYKRLLADRPDTGITEWVGIDSRPVGSRVMDAHKLDYPDASFDSVLCTNLLNYCISPPLVVDEMVRVLKPLGHLVVCAADTYEDDTEMLWGIREAGLGEMLVASELTIIDMSRHPALFREEAANMLGAEKYGVGLPPEHGAWIDALDHAYPLLISAVARKS